MSALICPIRTYMVHYEERDAAHIFVCTASSPTSASAQFRAEHSAARLLYIEEPRCAFLLSVQYEGAAFGTEIVFLCERAALIAACQRCGTDADEDWDQYSTEALWDALEKRLANMKAPPRITLRVIPLCCEIIPEPPRQTRLSLPAEPAAQD